jgi:hypothetical protein
MAERAGDRWIRAAASFPRSGTSGLRIVAQAYPSPLAPNKSNDGPSREREGNAKGTPGSPAGMD